MTKVSATTKSINDLIEVDYMAAVKDLFKANHYYVAFGVIASMIELMGSLYDGQPIEVDNISRVRFETALEKGFRGFGKGYENFIIDSKGTKPTHSLYKGLRCGMLHVMRPTNGFGLTHFAESLREKTSHLATDPATGLIVLICEELFEDVIEAWQVIKVDSLIKSPSDTIMTTFSIEY